MKGKIVSKIYHDIALEMLDIENKKSGSIYNRNTVCEEFESS